MSLVYAGVGSRKADVTTCGLMTKIAVYLREKGYWLRTGAADGADLAFARGGLEKTIMYLPWSGYNRNSIINFGLSPKIGCIEPTQAAINLAGDFHPAWNACTPATKKLHGRNMHIISGIDLNSPVKFILLWTLNAEKIGGTAQAWRYAESLGLPVFNLFNKSYEECVEFINSVEQKDFTNASQ